MTVVAGDDSSLQADSRPKSVGLVGGHLECVYVQSI